MFYCVDIGPSHSAIADSVAREGSEAGPLRVLSDTGEKSKSRYRFSPVGVVAIALVTVVAAFQVPNVDFEYDISELRARGLSYSG